MTILFVCSGNGKSGDVSPIVRSQANSLQRIGIKISIFPVIGKGLFGYLKNLLPLYTVLRADQIQIIHAHYSLCGIAAFLASTALSVLHKRKVPIVISLMGSDIQVGGMWKRLIRLLVRTAWSATIVKSPDMRISLGIRNPVIIPNGVNLGVFRYLDRTQCRESIGFKLERKIILFGADPRRKVKNYPLAKAASNCLSNPHQLVTLGNTPHSEVPQYLNACDVLLLTSVWEGSPNIIKEAMACGTPVVCTDVGDVRWLLDGLDGCYIAAQEPRDIASKLVLALQYTGKTQGRTRLLELGLDSESVAKKIVAVYEEVSGSI